MLAKAVAFSTALCQCFLEPVDLQTLLTLLPRHKWTSSEELLKIGDLVLIVDNETPRNSWRKGIVVNHLTDSEGTSRWEYLRVHVKNW